VVATGIEQAAIAKASAPAAAAATSAVATPDNRLADVTAKLRADNQRAVAATAQKSDAPRPAQTAPAAARAPANSIERAALAAIAAAVAPESMQPASYGDVTVRPIAQKPSLFPDLDVKKLEAQEPATPEAFIPQAAERAPLRAPRMPKFEDLPMPAQAEIRQARGEGEEEQHPQKVRMSLLQRLANVGLGRRDEETEPPIAARASNPAMAPLPPLPDRKPQRSVAEQMAASEPVSEYARRPAPQGLDSHGRPAPVAAAPQGDDHLDIPAFLRRQAN
jgi:cell division protein FtsZ